MDQDTQNPADETVSQAAAGVDEAQIAQLREDLAAREGGRPHDYIKALVGLAEGLPAGEERVALFLQAAELYTNKFKNQAEAVSAYEQVLAVEPSNAVAVDFLRRSYEKRRDWEKLIALMQREAGELGGDAQQAVHKEVAQLASDRIKKPAICIQLWAVVLEADPDDVDALRALSQLYERDRRYEDFSEVLSRLVQFTEDLDEKKKLLLKLGQVTGDRLKDDEKAADAYRQLLELDPNERRFQEQLKKRYIALGRWDELELFYAQSERWDEFIRVLESNEGRAKDTAQRINMLMKVAELWMTQKGKPDRAARAYEKVLGVEPEHLEAADRLIPIYAASNNARGLTGALEVKLRHVAEPSERLELLRQAAELYQGRAGDRDKAFERLLEAFTMVPGDPAAQEQVEEAARASGRWSDLVSAYAAALEDAEAVDATGLRLRLGRILVEELEKIDEALEQYQAVVDEEPDNEGALGALEELYRGAGRASDLLDIYRRRAELAIEPEQRKRILFEVATLQEGSLDQPAEAIETLQGVLLEDPVDFAALEALDRLYEKTGESRELAEVLARRIELEGSETTLLELKYRLAVLRYEQLEDPAGCLEQLREILLVDQQHEGARAALEGLLEGELQSDAAQILSSVYELAGDWERLLQTFDILVDGAEDVATKVELLRRAAATAATQTADAGRAFGYQAGALRADPGNEDARLELEQYAQTADRWEKLQALYTEIAAEAEPALSREYLFHLAQLQQSRGDREGAATSFNKLLELDPTDGEALGALDALYRGAEDWAQVASVYRRRIEICVEPPERERLQTELATILEHSLQEPEEAIAVYREILENSPGHAAGLAALDQLFERLERWGDLAENLEARLELAVTPEEEIALMLRIAQLREQRMKDVHSAVAVYSQVLDREPTNGIALAALERLATESDDDLMIAEILEPLYRQQGDFHKLISVYEVQVKREGDPESRVALLHQIAALQEDAGGDPNAAFDTYGRALAEEPVNEATLDALERLADVTQRHQDLAGTYERLASAEEDVELAGQLYTLAADTIERATGEMGRAVELYRKVLSIDRSNLAATEALERLYQGTEQHEESSKILQHKASILEDVDAQKAALYQAATIEESVLGRPEGAVSVFNQVLDIDPEDVRSIDALIELNLGLERWEQLLETQARKVDLVPDADEKKLIYYQMGAVFERELSDSEKAIDTYQKVLELDPDDLEALGRLDALFVRSENWTELLSVLNREAELTSSPEEAVSFQYRVGELYGSRLDDTPRALDLYREILNIQPQHQPTLAALEKIKDGPTEALAAAQVLEPVYESHALYAELIGVLQVQVAHADDAFGKVELLTRVATLYEDCLAEPAKAFGTYKQAALATPNNEECLAELERLAMSTGRWQEVGELYDKILEELEEPIERIEMGMRVGQVYEVQLELPDRAVPRYQGVLEEQPENGAALKALDRIFGQTQNWEELVAVLIRQASLAGSDEEACELKFRMGQIRQDQLSDLRGAIEAYGEVLELSPEHEAARGALEELFRDGSEQVLVGNLLKPLYQEAGDWERLNEIHLAQLEHLENPEERLAVYYQLGEDTEQQLMDPTGAYTVYAAAIMEAPLDERTGEELERLAGTIEDGWTELASTYADVVSQEEVSAEVQAELGKKLARVYEEELGDADKAKESYRFVLSVSPGEPGALENLDRIYTSFEEWAELAEVLELRANVADSDADRVSMLCRLGEVYETQLGDLDSAERSYRRLFDDLDGTNAEAIDALARIFEAKESWPDLVRVYERQLEHSAGDLEEAEIRAKLARVSLDHLGQLEAAAEGWKRVVELRGEDVEALSGLADIYEHQQQWAELGEILERQYEIAETDEHRVGALSRRAKLFCERLGRDNEGLETWQRVLDIDYSNVAALKAVADIQRGREAHEDLVSALHALLDQGAEHLGREDRIPAHRELGKVYSEILKQPYEAVTAWNNLLEEDPADIEAIDALEILYREEENWEEVVRVKVLRAEANEDPAEKVKELLEVTEMWRSQLENYDGAAGAYEKVLEAEPLHATAFDELEKLHRSAERWEPLLETYLSRLEHLEEASGQADLLRRVARVFEDKLDDTDQAFDALDQAFKVDYFDDVTSEYLGRMAQVTGRWKELIADTQRALEGEQDKKTRIQLCLTLGKWYGEDLGMMDYANAYYAQVVELDPANVRVLRQMANIYRLSGDYKQAGQKLQQAEKAAVQNEDRKMVYVDLGELLRKHMGESEQGLVYYKRALGVDPHLVAALDAMEEIHEQRAEFSELADVRKRRAEATTDPVELAEVQLKLASLYEEQLGDLEAAAGAYQAVVKSDGTNVAALRGLERAYTQLERWPELLEVLEKRLLAAQAERERVELLAKLAHIQEVQFLKFDEAIRRLQQVLELDPGRVEAYEALERCHRRLKQWQEFIDVADRHVAEISDSGQKIELYLQIGAVYAEEMSDPEQAIGAYQNIVDIDETNVTALEALAKLFEKRGDVHDSIEYLTRVAQLASDGAQQVNMYYRIGKATLEQLGDPIAAREKFEMALDLEPAHLPSLGALRGIFVEEGDWDAAARYLEQEQAATEAPRARARLLVQLAGIRAEHLGEEDESLEAYRQAIEIDPESEDAAAPLVQHYVGTKSWKEAEPLAVLLARRARGQERSEQHQINNTLGRIQAALGNYEGALAAYQTAFQLDVTSQESVRGIASVAYQMGDWPTSLTNYQRVLTALGEEDTEERTEVYHRLGCIKREQGQAKQAINNFEKALTLDGEHRPTLDELVSIYGKLKDWTQVAEYKRQILDSMHDEQERYELLLEIGDVWADHGGNVHKAIEALEEAQEFQPSSHILLHKLLRLYQQAGEWSRVVDSILSISELEDDADKKARYYYTMAQLYRDKLDDEDRAVELFNEALDLSASFLEAFERINKILTASRSWKQLERNYRKMIHRIAGKDKADLEHQLWYQLGLVYRDRIGDNERAIDAFKMASHAKPGDLNDRHILSELYEVTERFDDAIDHQRYILEQDPLKIDPYRALYRLFLHKRAYDEAWCTAAAINFMQKAGEEEKRFYADYRPAGILQVRGRLGNDHWTKQLFHPDQNIYVSKILEGVAGAALKAKMASLGAAAKPPDKKFKEDVATSTITFARTFGWAAQVLGIPVPDLYVRSDSTAALAALPLEPRASEAGRAVLSGFQPQELAFICGKHIATYRPELYIRNLFPAQADLLVMLYSGVAIAAPNTQLPREVASNVQATAQVLSQYMDGETREYLRTVVKRFMQDGARANLKLWNRGAELTSCRAALAICGDLEVARKIINSERGTPELSAADKMKDLLVFSVSERYAALRQALGVNIKAE